MTYRPLAAQRCAAALLTLGLLGSCSDTAGDDQGADGPVELNDAGLPARCDLDSDCNDLDFCNGREYCDVSGEAGFCAREARCAFGERCDGELERCVLACSIEPDADGDGHRAMACGGDDCDDADSNRYPGNPEVCDVDDHDEDCDPATFGVRDDDHDNYPDARCCNVDPETDEPSCGSDCDDQSPGIHPATQEVCNGLDDDCDGVVDSGLLKPCYADTDNDGFPETDAELAELCWDDARPAQGFCPPGFIDVAPEPSTADCNDEDPGVYPGAEDPCDGVDANCDGTPEPTVTCYQDGDFDGFAIVVAPKMAFCPDPNTEDGCPDGWTGLQPDAEVEGSVDCCDIDGATYPGAGGWHGSRNSCGSGDYNCDGVETAQARKPNCGSVTSDNGACGQYVPGWVQGTACFASTTFVSKCWWNGGQNRCEVSQSSALPRNCR